jgi:hypothetical protein
MTAFNVKLRDFTLKASALADFKHGLFNSLPVPLTSFLVARGVRQVKLA